MPSFLRDYWPDIVQHTREHIVLSALAVLGAVLLGVPLGVLITRISALRQPVLGFANIVQTIPSLAMFGFLLPVPFIGLGVRNALIALVLYSLLPIIRNTYVGITGVDGAVREAARAMGLTNAQILRRVELPLAADTILAGVRIATVLCIGITTIASFIGAGGLGELIQDGLRNNNNAATLAGAVPAALLALCADGLLGLLQRGLEKQRCGETTLARAVALPAGLAVGAAAIVALVGVPPSVGASNNAVSGPRVVIASKEFTESRLLADILVDAARSRGINAVRGQELGGNLCQTALLAGQIDAYPEYTGTAYVQILGHPAKTDTAAVYAAVKGEYASKFHLVVSPPLGFSNGFAMLIRGDDAARLHLKTLSDARPYAGTWSAGFGPDFISRADGWPGLSRTYGLQLKEPPHSLDLGLLNRALAAKQVDLIAGNETDGTIPSLHLFELQDNLHYFPPYQGIFVMRQDALERDPRLASVLDGLWNSLSTATMQKLNYEVDGENMKPEVVAQQWASAHGWG